jgi:hypothetical protein
MFFNADPMKLGKIPIGLMGKDYSDITLPRAWNLTCEGRTF